MSNEALLDELQRRLAADIESWSDEELERVGRLSNRAYAEAVRRGSSGDLPGEQTHAELDGSAHESAAAAAYPEV